MYGFNTFRYEIRQLGRSSEVGKEKENEGRADLVCVDDMYSVVKKSHVSLNHAGRDKRN